MFKRNYKFRIYPTTEQVQTLAWQLNRCRELYNAALTEWREAYRMRGVAVVYETQNIQLPDIKEARPEYKSIYSQVLQDVLRRVDKTRKAFYRRCKEGGKPGYPRFKSASRYNSLTYPQSGWSLKNNRLTLARIGDIRVRLHREIVGKVLTVTIKREADQWYVIFSVETEVEPLQPNSEMVGIDLGISLLAALSNGETIANPRWFAKSAARLKLKQQALARCKLGSNRRKEVRRKAGKATPPYCQPAKGL